jgi:uncharacterized damage-inducible protein DinB
MSAVTRPEAVLPVDEKQQFLAAYERECATTMKLLRSYPASEGDFRPHPRSMSARQLAFMFTAEAGAGMAALSDTLRATGELPPPPPTMADVTASFEQASHAMRSAVAATPAAALQAKIAVPAGKGITAEVRKLDFLWLMLNDQIHHRGQLSVYTRMAGGKVPSLYGPSADEPWF